MSQFTQRVSAAGNDGYWAGSWFVDGSWWAIGKNYYGDALHSAARFTNVTIPQGSTINSAYLTLTGYTNESTPQVYTRFYGLDEDNTADFTSDPISRPQTAAYTDWDFSAVVYQQEYTIDVTSIVQEIINRAGWGSNNALGIIHVDDGSTTNYYHHFITRTGDSARAAYIEINYTPPSNLITKEILYRVRRQMTPITKLLRYCVTDPETSPVTFSGIKIAKSGHNVLNTKNPNNLKFSSDYNTLKYFMSGTAQMHVTGDAGEFYNIVGYIEHNLGYFPFAEVYARDDLMSAYCPLGRLQIGSGAYRQFFFYVTATRLYIVANGWTTSDPVDYYVDFYYKIFKNNLNL